MRKAKLCRFFGLGHNILNYKEIAAARDPDALSRRWKLRVSKGRK